MRSDSLLVAVVVAVATLVSVAAPARAEAPREAEVRLLDDGAYASRAGHLERWLADFASRRPYEWRPENPHAFCTPFLDFDMQRTAHGWWRELERVPRDRLLEGLVGHVVRCRFTKGSTKRAGFLIDYLYWNELAGTLGHELGAALQVRDALYEHYAATLARDVLAVQLEVSQGHLPTTARGDFFDAPPMSRIRVYRRLGQALTALSFDQRRVFNAVVDTVDFREGYLLPFGHRIRSLVDDPRDRAFAASVYRYLLHLRRHPELLAERHGGYRALVARAGGDEARVFRVLGVLSSLLYLPLQEFAPALAHRGVLSAEALEAVHDGTVAYYLINELDERAAVRAGDDGRSASHHFFYPPGYSTESWKWYHFFNNAHLACEFVRRRLPREAIVGGLTFLGMLYEGTTLNLTLPSRRTLSLEPRAHAMVESLDDVRTNRDGAEYGVTTCR